MSCCHTEALSPYTFDRSERAPTNTFTHQQQFSERLRGVLSRINARLREAIDEQDLFNLRSEALVDDPPEEIFETDNRRTALRGFLAWLREQLNDEFLTVVGPDRNQFIRAAYIVGLRNAHHSTGTIKRAQELNRDADTEIAAGHGEWDAAMDSRTCDLCAALNGVQFRLDEMENKTISVLESAALPQTFIGNAFRLKPPIHPNGRCNVRLVVGSEITDSIDDRLPAGIQA